MKNIVSILIGVLFCMSSHADEAVGIIGKKYEDNFSVIYKLVNELPDETVRSQLQWLTVVSWKYDGSSNSGMPPSEDNTKMITLEDAIKDKVEAEGVVRHAYSRTGNGLKEFVYYINDRDQFSDAFNNALDGHPEYPIEISFYKDQEWQDFKKLLNDFTDKVK